MTRLSRDEFTDLVLDLARDSIFGTRNDGVCLNCHHVQGGCEPDAENNKCDDCGELKVWGAEQIMLMRV